MSDFYFLTLGKLNRGKGHLLSAVRHNRREIQVELGSSKNIDPSRTHLNESLVGEASADAVAAYAERLMREANVRPLRKDAVRAVELIFSLPPDHRLDERSYFVECIRWVDSFLGGVILSADIHRDEASPHCHVLVLPLIDGRMNGSSYVGYKSNLKSKHQSFYLEVGSRFGLRKPPERLSLMDRRKFASLVIANLKHAGDPALESIVWIAIRDCIERDPLAFGFQCGIDVPSRTLRPLKTMAQIFTSKGRGRSSSCGRSSSKNLSCVGFADLSPPSEGHRLHDISFPLRETRIREAEQDPANFDSIRGEFYQPPKTKKRSLKSDSQEWVSKELKRRREG
jgi:hypothetical protein